MIVRKIPSPYVAAPGDALIRDVLKLWDKKLDTAQIGEMLDEPEPAIERALHVGLEQRRQP